MKEKPPALNIMRYAGLSTQWMAMLLLAVWVGFKLDKWIWSIHIFVILLPVVSLVVSMWQLVREVNKPAK